MAGPIQNVPRGLLGLLQLKTAGSTIPALADVLFPGLEMLPFYLVEREEYVGGNVNASSVAQTSVETVPNGELWYVKNLGLNTDTLDADQALTACGIIVTTTGLNISIGVEWSVAASTRGHHGVAYHNFILTPGTGVGARVSAITVGAAGGLTLSRNLTLVRLAL